LEQPDRQLDVHRLRQLARREAGNSALADRALAAARDTSSVLASLDPEETRRHLQAIAGVVVDAYADGRALSDTELRVILSLGADRAHQHVPLDAVIAGFQTARNELVRALVDSARLAGIDSALVVDALIELDTLLIEVEHQLVQAQLSAEAELRRTNRDLEAGVVREVFLGVPQSLSQLARVGVEASRRYHCVVSGADDLPAIEATDQYLSLGADVHTAVLDGYLVALAWRLPPSGADAPDLVVATPAAALMQLAPLYRLALRALDSARRRQLHGLQLLEALALDTAGTALADLGSVLAERLNGALDPSRAYNRELVATTLAHLEGGGSIEESAARLHLHPNTVKYRLRRLAELVPSSPRPSGVGLGLPERFSWWLSLSSWSAQVPLRGGTQADGAPAAGAPKLTVPARGSPPWRPDRRL
jgi:hypothetical protein